MSGHTPGPWKAKRYPEGDCWHIHFGDKGGWLGEVYIDGDDTGATSDARLIAAAPDLLEAGAGLQAARKAQKLSPSAENLSRVRIASAAFDAAISRATGEDRSEKGGAL